jgi:NSS family neurotransmitter:Na+ symporter
VASIWRNFRSNPLELGAWYAAFVLLTIFISARGLQRGIESANKFRAVGLLILLLILVGYSLSTGDVRHGLQFAFAPHFSAITPQVVLSAIGQAFYATGVGQAMMIAYGAYVEPGTSLVRTSFAITASILFVSLLATMMIFPLVFRYGINPAQGLELVFDLLPRIFAEMAGGRIVGTLFFLLLVLAALMPSVALLEPGAAWLTGRRGISRTSAVWITAGSSWVLGLGSILSLNRWSEWYPLNFVPALSGKTFFEVIDYVTSNIMLPLGALLTSVLVGWRLSAAFASAELTETTPIARTACVWLLRYICPLAILAIFIATWF